MAAGHPTKEIVSERMKTRFINRPTEAHAGVETVIEHTPFPHSATRNHEAVKCLCLIIGFLFRFFKRFGAVATRNPGNAPGAQVRTSSFHRDRSAFQ